jgi:hypothetical protein
MIWTNRIIQHWKIDRGTEPRLGFLWSIDVNKSHNGKRQTCRAGYQCANMRYSRTTKRVDNHYTCILQIKSQAETCLDFGPKLNLLHTSNAAWIDYNCTVYGASNLFNIIYIFRFVSRFTDGCFFKVARLCSPQNASSKTLFHFIQRDILSTGVRDLFTFSSKVIKIFIIVCKSPQVFRSSLKFHSV